MFYVVDSIMGSGKTTAMFRYVLEHEDIRFMYVTPYLSELERGLDELHDFKEPERFGTKLSGVKYLLRKKSNITTTHALFRRFDDECIELIRAGGYVLIMDECYDPFGEADKNEDIDIVVRSGYARVDSEGFVRWEKPDYEGEALRDIRDTCDAGKVVAYKGIYLIVTNPEVFRAFKEGFVLTYMFKGQSLRYYFDSNGIEWGYKYINKYHQLVDEFVPQEKKNFGELIHVSEDPKLNEVGDRLNSLSKSAFLRFGKGLTDKLRNNMYTYGKRRVGATSKQVMWTCYKDWKDEVGDKRYRKSFVSCSAKATNIYMDRTVLMYLMNRYMNVGVKHYLVGKGMDVDDDEFALSEMLQWIFRSAVRNGEEIWIYIPSRRMRSLLLSWIKEVDGDA